ncbi:MAG: hypothetical protein IKW60_03765 [Clostridia bacterium]|nr:hypothetical protein [Clostridia bacterium]
MAEESMDLSCAVDMLKEMLSGEEGQQTIQNLMGILGDVQTAPAPGVATGGLDPENLEMMMRLQKVMSMMHEQKNSSRTRLLMALKPFLKSSRQSKVDMAMQMMNLGQVFTVMKETGEGG